MKVLLLNGSAKRNGCTNEALSEIASVLESEGISAEIFHIGTDAICDCTGCGACAARCPAHAIVLRDGRPGIDRRACIRCFCCQEFCPAGAMGVRRPLPARLLAPGRK